MTRNYLRYSQVAAALGLALPVRASAADDPLPLGVFGGTIDRGFRIDLGPGWPTWHLARFAVSSRRVEVSAAPNFLFFDLASSWALGFGMDARVRVSMPAPRRPTVLVLGFAFDQVSQWHGGEAQRFTIGSVGAATTFVRPRTAFDIGGGVYPRLPQTWGGPIPFEFGGYLRFGGEFRATQRAVMGIVATAEVGVQGDGQSWRAVGTGGIELVFAVTTRRVRNVEIGHAERTQAVAAAAAADAEQAYDRAQRRAARDLLIARAQTLPIPRSVPLSMVAGVLADSYQRLGRDLPPDQELIGDWDAVRRLIENEHLSTGLIVDRIVKGARNAAPGTPVSQLL